MLVGLLIVGTGLSQQDSAGGGQHQTLQYFYSLQRKHILAMLPPHSAFPPILDLSKEQISEHPKDKLWEYRSSALFGSTPITDPGLNGPEEATTDTWTYVDGDPTYALPAKGSDVVIAVPVTGETRVAYNHKLVYSRFELQILQVLKGKAKDGLYAGAHISALQLGGAVRFPSGHQQTFIMMHEGFVGIGKQYLLFIWKPSKGSCIASHAFPSSICQDVQSYAIGEAYLIQRGVVFPIIANNQQTAYSGMSWTAFEAKVKHAIAKNINTN
ncbi:MAG TPA: hypothetical protein VF283_23560 [Bryobacteraceae bacterium]